MELEIDDQFECYFIGYYIVVQPTLGTFVL